MGNFRNLKVWTKAKNLAVEIYRITREGDFSKDFRLCDQIRSAAVSISSNIAEGDELNTNRQSIRHFYIAKGSCAEVITQLIIATEINYLPKSNTELLIDKLEHISAMLQNLIKSRAIADNKI